ncbi:MAG TPA: hypothetical protein VHO72_12050, partial [Bacteroidales bacterium]|nr:hypothetical protein [Bacteroidales bacterium]
MKQFFTILTAILITGLSFGQTIQLDVKEGCAPLKVHATCLASNPATKYYRWNFDYSYNTQITQSSDTLVTFTEKGY